MEGASEVVVKGVIVVDVTVNVALLLSRFGFGFVVSSVGAHPLWLSLLFLC